MTLDYGAIKETLREGIWRHMRVFFVDLESGDPKPPYPFISHKFTTPYLPEASHERNEGANLIRETQATMTISLTVYSRDKTEVLNTAQRLWQWFRFQGYEYLANHGLVVVTIEGMEDRTTFLETDYEHRVGFDVVLRVADREERAVNIIEKVILNNEMIGG